jgi:hypothetical protein
VSTGRDPILDQIDNVLDDFATSPDAMRWTPEVSAAPARPGILLELPPPDSATAALVLQRVEGTMRALTDAFNGVAKFVIGVAREMGKAFTHFGHVLQDPKHNRSRCRRCSPFANPLPMSGGVEYHRRRQARKRRAR